MKSLSLVILTVLVAGIFLSCMSLVPFDYSEEKMFTFEGVEQDDLFVYTGEFLADYIRDSRVANEFIDKEGGKIIGDFHTIAVVNSAATMRVYINYNITVRAGKTRVALNHNRVLLVRTDFYGRSYVNEYSAGLPSGSWFSIEDQKKGIERAYDNFFVAYENYVNKLARDDF